MLLTVRGLTERQSTAHVYLCLVMNVNELPGWMELILIVHKLSSWAHLVFHKSVISPSLRGCEILRHLAGVQL